MLNRLDLRGARGPLRDHLPRPGEEAEVGPLEAVQGILADVRARGDEAVLEYTARFDGVESDALRVDPAEPARALQDLDPALREALVAARDAIDAFHRTQRRHDHTWERDGIVISGRTVPVDRAGVYVPGGRGAYPSSVLMTAVPARVAGVGEVALCVPPDRTTGQVHPAVLAAAALAGVDEVYAMGGAQAIGALAYGTASVRPVDVIVGPGNLYVALAKREVSGVVGIPSAFAGPSEIVVVADASTPVDFVAIDLLVQAEHGPNGLSWLITWSSEVADAVSDAVARLTAAAPRRADIEATLGANGYAVVVDGPEQAMEVANAIAPEHLQLMTAEPEALAGLVRHAGAVFCGPLSALTVDDFTKQVHVITVTPDGFGRVAGHVATLADTEGFDAHASSVRLRAEAVGVRLPEGGQRS